MGLPRESGQAARAFTCWLARLGCASAAQDGAANSNQDLTGAASGAVDASTGDDGAPVRNACTSSFGNGLSGSVGRIDGQLVAVVAAGTHTCHGDSTHVHLQVLAQGQVYDVAVNVDGGNMAEKDLALPGAAWSEGWHAGQRIDYVHDLGLHSTDFQFHGPVSQLDNDLETALASANHISVFATAYSHGGMHLIHRSTSSSGADGAVVTDPLSPTAHVYAFHFANQSF